MKEDRFVFTPRIWVGSFVASEGQEQVTEETSLPMFGGTISYTSKHLPQVSLMATILTGSGDGRILHQTHGLGTRDISRKDFEFLGRYDLPDSNVYLLLGFRYVTFDGENKGYSNSTTFRETNDVKIRGPELGFGFSQNVTKDGRQQVFGNLLGLFASTTTDFKDSTGFAEKQSFFSPGVDVNVGYQFWITPTINVNARYRSFIYSYQQVATFGGVTETYRDLAIFHGPEFGASFVF